MSTLYGRDGGGGKDTWMRPTSTGTVRCPATRRRYRRSAHRARAPHAPVRSSSTTGVSVLKCSCLDAA